MASCVVAAPALGQVTASGERVALVIGNSTYKAMPLENPRNDAQAMADLLRQAGFTVDTQYDTSQQDLAAAVERFGKTIRQPSVKFGLFYYAGHGLQLDWRNYLVPVSADIQTPADVRKQTVDVSYLLKYMEEARGRNFLVILDACRDDPFGDAFRPPAKGLSQFDAPAGSMLAYATAPGSVAMDGTGKNGLYTSNLLREFAVKGARIEDAFKRVRLNVRLASQGKQIPWESTSLEEDVYLFPTDRRKLSEAEQDQLLEREIASWLRVKSSNDVQMLASFVREYPSGSASELAQARLNRLLSAQAQREQADLEAARIRIAEAQGQRPTQAPEPAVQVASRNASQAAEQERQREAERQREQERLRQEEQAKARERERAAAAEAAAAAERIVAAERQASFERERLREQEVAQARERERVAQAERVAAAEREAAAARDRLNEQELAQARERARVAAAERAALAERRAAEERQLAAERVAAAEREAALERQAAAAKQAEAERQAVIERAAAAEQQAALDRQIAAERQAALARQAEAERAAAQAKTTATAAAPVLTSTLPSTPFYKGYSEHQRDYRVGDVFSFTLIDGLTKAARPLQLRVTAVDIDADRVEYNGGEYVSDFMGNMTATLRGAFTMPRQFYPAELYVGKKWQTAFKQVRPNGITYTYRYDVRVVGKETITVPAGTFEAFKIEARGFNVQLGAALSRNIWVTPGVPADIAHETIVRLRNGAIEQFDRQELVSLAGAR
ncbi:MAG: caspase family protein [Ramlibacter sp.]